MKDHGTTYWHFAAMIASSIVAMFMLTYVNIYDVRHIHWSETRFYMAFVMGAAMAVIMLSYMLRMYGNRRINLVIYIGSLGVFVLALWLVRSQATIEDSAYMKAMIPHHSIAILTSERANIDDVRVRELAGEIETSQRREIAEMKWLLDDIRRNGKATTPAQAEARPVPEFSGHD